MKNIFLLLLVFSHTVLPAQQLYCDFEGTKFIRFGWATGALDSIAANPMPDSINGSSSCAKYIRDTSTYDNFKLFPYEKLVDVTPYANNTFQTPKIKMKIFSTAVPGIEIDLQLGIKSNDVYPDGVHSIYRGITTRQNEWEEITFNFNQIPAGSNVSPLEIDKIVVLLAPNTNDTDTFYFDDLMGPALLVASVPSPEIFSSFKLFQNIPNPVKESTNIKLHLNSQGFVSLKIYDLLGNEIVTLLNEEMKPGTYSIPVDAGNIPDGLYFYVLKKDGISHSKKMIVSKK